jgi:hypothetical protein
LREPGKERGFPEFLSSRALPEIQAAKKGPPKEKDRPCGAVRAFVWKRLGVIGACITIAFRINDRKCASVHDLAQIQDDLSPQARAAKKFFSRSCSRRLRSMTGNGE